MGHNLVAAGDITGDDPLGWHKIEPPPPSACMRRRRRVDVWLDGEIRIDATFRDSMWGPDGSEIVVHEYRIEASADSDTRQLNEVRADARVLPFRECPLAAPNATRLVGLPMRGLRDTVLDTLQSTDCCTHLNDALRGLAEVPVLLAALQESGGSGL
jgi:hypothetical protein